MRTGNGVVDLVLVDFDDTLVDTGPRFQNARRSVITLLTEAGFPGEAVRDMLYNQVDPVMREQFGLGPRRMEPAFVATYERLCAAHGRAVDPVLRERCAELGRGCYGAAPPFDGALDALRRLSAQHRTVVYSQSGDLAYQRECIRGAGVIDIITDAHVHVSPRKDVETFRQTLRTFAVRDPAAAWMIGNSMRSDINPALEAGANAILVEAHDPWEYDVVEPVSPRFHRVRSFPAAVELLLP